MSDLFSLAGQTAVVTGGGRGLGAAIVQGMAEAGARVGVLDIEEESAKLSAQAVDGHAAQVDVADRQSVRSAIAEVTAALGPIAILVNAAGIGGFSEAVSYPDDLWERVIAVNLTGTLNCCLEAAPAMLERRSGAIVNVASNLGLVGLAGMTGYAASKGGVVQLTRTLAVEWATRGIRVNALAPCTFETPLVQAARAADEQMFDDLLNRTPMHRNGDPKEIVGPAIFLASAAASMVTGHILAVDGGYLAW